MANRTQVGEKIDMLTIIKDLGDRVESMCDCGNTIVLHKRNFYSPYKKSCGCHRRKSEVGNTYGYLTVIEDYIGKSEGGHKICRAICRCGREVETKTIYLTTNDVKSCGCMKSDTYINLNYDIFKERTPESLYWAGFIAADGCVTDENKLIIRLQVSDVGHLEKFKKWINASVKIQHNRNNNTYGISIGNKIVCKDLLEYGIGQRKSLTYTPPQFCCESPDFWRGMVDGDGCIPKRGGSVEMCGTEDTCIEFKGFVNKFCESRAKITPHGRIFTVRFGGRAQSSKIMQKLYGNNPKFYLDRKYALANKFCNFPLAHDSGII